MLGRCRAGSVRFVVRRDRLDQEPDCRCGKLASKCVRAQQQAEALVIFARQLQSPDMTDAEFSTPPKNGCDCTAADRLIECPDFVGFIFWLHDNQLLRVDTHSGSRWGIEPAGTVDDHDCPAVEAGRTGHPKGQPSASTSAVKAFDQRCPWQTTGEKAPERIAGDRTRSTRYRFGAGAGQGLLQPGNNLSFLHWFFCLGILGLPDPFLRLLMRGNAVFPGWTPLPQ